MKTITIAAALAVSIGLLAAVDVSAQIQSSATSNDNVATASIVTAIGIAKGEALRFGQIVTGSSAGTVMVDTAGARTLVSGTTRLANSTTVGAASFTVTGTGTDTYEITLPSSPVTITSGANDTMTVDAFTSDPDGTGTLAGGTQPLNVGATLHVGAGQASGDYSGTFSVMVNYN